MTTLSRDLPETSTSRQEPTVGHALRLVGAGIVGLMLFVTGVATFIQGAHIEAGFWFLGFGVCFALVAYKSGAGEMADVRAARPPLVCLSCGCEIPARMYWANDGDCDGCARDQADDL